MKHGPTNAQPDGDQPGNTTAHSFNSFKRDVKAAWLLIAAVTLGVAACSVHKPARVVQGEVQAAEIKVVPKVVGRVRALHVCPGDKVRKGQLLVSLEDRDLQAKLEQARVAMELAKAYDERVRAAGVEHICAQSNWWMSTKAVAERAEQNVTRSRALKAAEVISPQELRDLERDLDWAQSSERAAKASFNLAVALFSDKGKLAAASNHEQATQTVAELEALIAELAITSPVDGEVQGGMPREGELVTLGIPAAKIVDPQNLWVRFNVPEDLRSNIRMGSTLRVRVPALGNQEVPVKVSYISPDEGFAARQAANGTRGFDHSTFQVRAVPVQVTEGLRSGMSALLTCGKFN